MSLNSFPNTCNLHIQRGNLSCAQHRPGSKWKLTSPSWSTDLCSPTSGSALGLGFNGTLALWEQLAPSCLRIRPQTDSYSRCSITAFFFFFFTLSSPISQVRAAIQAGWNKEIFQMKFKIPQLEINLKCFVVLWNLLNMKQAAQWRCGGWVNLSFWYSRKDSDMKSKCCSN